jgi:hypothetical protein
VVVLPAPGSDSETYFAAAERRVHLETGFDESGQRPARAGGVDDLASQLQRHFGFVQCRVRVSRIGMDGGAQKIAAHDIERFLHLGEFPGNAVFWSVGAAAGAAASTPNTTS